MNSLLQRAGRCARFQGEQGEIYVYWSFQVNQIHSELAARDLDTESEEHFEKKQNFLPYPNESCELTWQVLQEHTASEKVNQNVGFRLEEAWINQVHRHEDLLQAKRRQNNKMNFEERFKSAVFTGDRSAATELIRLVDSRSIFVWEEATLIDLDNQEIDPNKLHAFSVPISALCKIWRDIQNREYEIEWVFRRIEAPKDKAAESYSQPPWTPIASREALITSVRILVHPRYVSYDDKVGLVISIDEDERGNRFCSPLKPRKSPASEYIYYMDTYVGHLGCMWTCWHKAFRTERLKNGELSKVTYASIRDELLQPGGRFIRARIFPHATEAETEALFEYLVFFAVLIHDLGKLQVKWQEVMRGWQAIAHSSFKGKNPQSHLLSCYAA